MLTSEIVSGIAISKIIANATIICFLGFSFFAPSDFIVLMFWVMVFCVFEHFKFKIGFGRYQFLEDRVGLRRLWEGQS